MKNANPFYHGRGTFKNPPNRYLKESTEPIPDDEKEDIHEEPITSPCKTQFIPDTSKKILSFNASPDIRYDVGINVYRGCEHGCTYCYARGTHEYLGYSSGVDFESIILVKEKAPLLLQDALSAETWKPQVIVMSGVTDPYQPIERRLKLTRACLHVLNASKNPVSIITKNYLVTRDYDLLQDLASVHAARVYLSINSLDSRLASALEPRAATPKRRLEAMSFLAKKGIPVSLMLAPVISGLNDKDIPHLIRQAKEAGAESACYTYLRLPNRNRELFEGWLDRHYPMRKEKVMSRLHDIKQGQLKQSDFYERFKGHGVHAHMIRNLFHMSCRRYHLSTKTSPLNTKAFQRPSNKGQLYLF